MCKFLLNQSKYSVIKFYSIMGVFGTLFSILISLIVLAIIIWYVLYPEPIKYVLLARQPGPKYEANANATKTATSTLYSSPESKHETLVVIFIGGGALFSDMSSCYGFANQLNENLGPEYDILVFQYPVRFKHTVLDAMLATNKILMNYIHYKTVHAVGISFGSILAGAFYQKETALLKSTAMKVPQIGMKFSTLSMLSGLVECEFNVDLLTKLFKFYIMRGTPGLKYYTCYGLPIPKFLASANTDFLISQTAKFIQQEHCEYKIYQSKTLTHAFCQYMNLDEALDVNKRVSDFIKNNDNKSLNIDTKMTS